MKLRGVAKDNLQNSWRRADTMYEWRILFLTSLHRGCFTGSLGTTLGLNYKFKVYFLRHLPDENATVFFVLLDQLCLHTARKVVTQMLLQPFLYPFPKYMLSNKAQFYYHSESKVKYKMKVLDITVFGSLINIENINQLRVHLYTQETHNFMKLLFMSYVNLNDWKLKIVHHIKPFDRWILS